MLNKNIKIISSLCMAIMMCVAGVISANAAEAAPSAEEVFPAEQVKQLQEEAAKKPIYNDKDENGNMTLNRTRSTGSYPTRKGVILVTDDKYKGVVPTGHAAIVYDAKTVIESLPNGVVKGQNKWYEDYTTCTGITVIDTTTAQDSTAANWCYKQLGKPYNWNYWDIDNRNAFYCSQLVYAAFKDNFNINLNTGEFLNAVHPSELVNSSETRVNYRK